MIPFLTTAENFRLVKATGFSFTDLIVAPQGGGRLDPSLGYEPLYVTFTVKVEPNTKKLIPGWELGFRAVPRDQRAELIFRHHVFRHDSSWLVSRAAAGRLHPIRSAISVYAPEPSRRAILHRCVLPM